MRWARKSQNALRAMTDIDSFPVIVEDDLATRGGIQTIHGAKQGDLPCLSDRQVLRTGVF